MEITKKGQSLQTLGTTPTLGQQVNDFVVYDKNEQAQTPTSLFDKLTLISVVPDINTRVCSLSTKRFNEEVDQFAGINFYTISTNEPADQQAWCAAENVEKMQLLSDKDGSFGKAFGLYEPINKFDARSIWIIDQSGTVVYRELITEQVNEPDYQAALTFLKK